VKVRSIQRELGELKKTWEAIPSGAVSWLHLQSTAASIKCQLMLPRLTVTVTNVPARIPLRLTSVGHVRGQHTQAFAN